MTSSPLPSKIRLNQNQFLGDLGQVFRRHKIPSGGPGDLEHLASDLQSNEAFRSDLFSLCTAISHMSEKDLSPEALLDLVARALTNTLRKSAPLTIPDEARSTFLSQYQAWSTRGTEFGPIGQEPEADDPHAWQSPPNPFSTAATLSGRSSQLDKPHEAGPPLTPSRSLAPDTPIGSLTLGELKSYLEDIEQRVSRLQPILDAVSKSAPSDLPAAQAPPTIPKFAAGPIPTPIRTRQQNPATPQDPFESKAADRSARSQPPEPSLGLVPPPPSPNREPTPASFAPTPPPAPVETVRKEKPAIAAIPPVTAVVPDNVPSVRPPKPSIVAGTRFQRPATHPEDDAGSNSASLTLQAAIDGVKPAQAARVASAVAPAVAVSPRPAPDSASIPKPHTADSLRGRIPISSRTLAPAAAVAVLVVSVGILGYRHLSPAASAATAVATNTPEAPSVNPSPVAQPAPAIARNGPAEHTRAGQPTSKPAPAPTPKTTVPSRPVAATPPPTSSSLVASAVKPLLRSNATPAPEAPVGPAMKQPAPVIPDSSRPTPVVPAPREAPAETRQVIEPYNQRTVTTPSSTPEPQPTNVAANAHPPAPAVTLAPITRKEPEPNLVVSVPSPTMMTYAISAPSPVYPNFRRPIDTPVVIQASIGKDGRVLSAHSVSGASDLANAAVTAVQKWRFRPYLVDGNPVQVVTNIKFVFKAPM